MSIIESKPATIIHRTQNTPRLSPSERIKQPFCHPNHANTPIRTPYTNNNPKALRHPPKKPLSPKIIPKNQKIPTNPSHLLQKKSPSRTQLPFSLPLANSARTR